MTPSRVFVTGMGVVGPHGDGADAVFDRVSAGESAVKMVDSGEGPVAATLLMAPADSFDPGRLLTKPERLFMARVSEMAVTAAHDALDQADLLEDPAPLREGGVYMGCGLGGPEAFEEASKRFYGRGTRRGRPGTVALIMVNGPTGHLSMRWGIVGPTLSYAVACSSSAISVGEAYRALRDGRHTRALAGGTEAMLTPGVMAAWENLGVVAREHEDGPGASCRPFDRARTGMVLGEGSVVFVLETEEAVDERGAEPLAEVLGYGIASDAHNITEPLADGQVRAMEEALADAGIAGGDLDYVNAHATGTDSGDVVELESLRRVLGDAVGDVPVSATKALHGHLVGAAGAMELLITIQALRRGVLPPTANLTAPDEAAEGFDLIPLEARTAPAARYALSNSFAFGGTNAALIVGKV